MEDSQAFRYVPVVVGLAVFLSAGLSLLVPPGEAPDEPAHVRYVDHLVRHGSLPPVKGRHPNVDAAYESYQPPLAYLVMAGPLVLAGFEHVDYPFSIDPSFAFQRNRRVFLPAPSSARADSARKALHAARAINLLWLAVASGAILVTCLRLCGSPWVAFGAGVPFALSPQLLFTASTVGNDAAVVALASVAVASLVVLVSSPGRGPALAASTAAGLALWAKASAVVLAPAVALAAAALIRAGRRRTALALLVPGLVLAAGWAALELQRTGSVFPNPPTGWGEGGGLDRLFTEPRWLLSAWGSFWAKLGWLNVILPWPAYLAFVPPTLTALIGLYMTCRPATRSRAGLILGVVAAANVLLLVFYMVRVDWQPQGRYVLPSCAAIAGLAALGLERACGALRPAAVKVVAMVSCLVSVAVATGTLAVVAAVY